MSYFLSSKIFLACLPGQLSNNNTQTDRQQKQKLYTQEMYTITSIDALPSKNQALCKYRTLVSKLI